MFLASLCLMSMLSVTPVPKSYVCFFTPKPIRLDGSLSDPAWAIAPWTDDFEDIEGDVKPKPRFRTRSKMLWDRDNLYIGAELEEPQIWATLTDHDSVIFRDNDFEVFIDPDNDGCFYSELELNAFNTTWDLLLPRAYRGGGPAIDGFELAGLRTAVKVEGAINDPSHKSKGWTVEMAIPWKAFKDMARVKFPPANRDQWRINFSRVEWHVDVVDGKFVKRSGLPEDNWVWSPQRVVDMHRPERWGILQFSDLSEGQVEVDSSPGLAERELLVEAWEAEHRFRSSHGKWATSAQELAANIEGLEVFATPNHFELVLNGFRMDETLRFTRDKP